MLYSNSHSKIYSLRNIIVFYQNFTGKKINLIRKDLKFNFLFKIFFLENFSIILKTSLYQNFIKKTATFEKVNFVLILFFIKTFLKQFRHILNIMYLLGFNNLNIFFLFLSKNFFFFEHFYSIFFKKYFATFNNLKKLYRFKKRYLYRFKFWFPLKWFLRKRKIKFLILWSVNKKPIFKKFLNFLKITTFSFDLDINNLTLDYTLGLNKISNFQKLVISQFMLNSYISGRYDFKLKKHKELKKNKLLI